MMTTGNDRLRAVEGEQVSVRPLPSVISRESIESRLLTLKAERAQVINNANAYNGAIQECERWLRVLDGSE